MKIYIGNICKWEPSGDLKAPALEFVNPMFKRRFSQLTKMTIQVVHDVIEKDSSYSFLKVAFSSFYGELKRQFSINKSISCDGEVSPADFSLSVFNAPVAAASIALGLKAGYSAAFSSDRNFKDLLKVASAPVLCGEEEKIIFVYADEETPEEYKSLGEINKALAFAFIISSAPFDGSIEIDLDLLDESLESFIGKYAEHNL